MRPSYWWLRSRRRSPGSLPGCDWSFGQAARWTFSDSLIAANCIWRSVRQPSRASVSCGGDCCRINSSSCIALQGTSRGESTGILDGTADNATPTGNLVCPVWARFCRNRTRQIKARPESGDACALSVGSADLATSDLVSVLPLNVAKNMTRSHPLVFRRLSRSPKPIEAAMIWLRRLDNQPAHAWLRDVISRVTSELQDS
jgi:hypothetical protein